jgi:cell division protein FtsZ
VQSNSHEEANKREQTPLSGSGMAHQSGFEMNPGQEDQWAVLRHEVEKEDVNRQEKRERSARDQRDTEDDANTSTPTPQTSFQLRPIEQSPNQVDIVVVGVGGAGMNAVNRMIDMRVRGVRFVALNTDAQVLSRSAAPERICLGQHYTKGLGAGGNSAVGARAATESEDEIRAILRDADLVFIAAGMGGGTGTGGAPVVASIAKKLGALTIGIVTLPFTFEGTQRQRAAEEGIMALSAEIDALIIVPNNRLLSLTGRDRSLADAFKLADDVLRQGVQGIAEVINVPGLINVDFADVRSVLREAGTALMSIGQGNGRNRAQRAAEEAIAGGFLNVSIRGAQRVLFNISGGEDMTLYEVNEVAEYIGAAIDNAADITFGAVIDPALDDTIRVTLIAAGMEESPTRRKLPIRLEQVSTPSVAPLHPGTLNTPASPSRNISNLEQPPAMSTSTPGQSLSPEQSVARPLPPGRPFGPSSRMQRSLDDLRGLRGMGHRRETQQGSQKGNEEEDELEAEEIDVPPFLKKYN